MNRCNSNVGMVGPGSQPVNMDDKCALKEMQHELIHALGLEHEHQRPDRDRYVRIIYENVQPGISRYCIF